MDYRFVIGLGTVLIALPSYAIYIQSVISGKTLPHLYSWLIWAMLAFTAFSAQISSDAGPGAWNTGTTALGCSLIAAFALKKGVKSFRPIDKVLFAAALVAGFLQFYVNNSIAATSLVTFAALIGFALTSKKAYATPHEENIVTFSLNSIRLLLSMFALEAIAFSTFFYPFVLFFANTAVVLIIFFRRR